MLSLNWLPLSDRKNIDTPKIIVEDFAEQNYGGYYLPGESLIVVVDWPGVCLARIIAHEFRHHTQYVLNKFRNISSKTVNFSDYREGVRDYYRTQPHEFDALLYEVKYAKDEVNYWQLKHLVLPDKLPETY